MKPIQEAYTTKKDIKSLMMPVMLPRSPSKEIIAAVCRRRLNQLKGEKGPHGQHMRSQYHGRQGNWQRVGEHVLQRVRILRREGHGSGELVVDLVDTLVEPADVQRAVGVVEERFAGEQADYKVAGELKQAGDFCGDTDGWGLLAG